MGDDMSGRFYLGVVDPHKKTVVIWDSTPILGMSIKMKYNQLLRNVLKSYMLEEVDGKIEQNIEKQMPKSEKDRWRTDMKTATQNTRPREYSENYRTKKSSGVYTIMSAIYLACGVQPTILMINDKNIDKYRKLIALSLIEGRIRPELFPDFEEEKTSVQGGRKSCSRRLRFIA